MQQNSNSNASSNFKCTYYTSILKYITMTLLLKTMFLEHIHKMNNVLTIFRDTFLNLLLLLVSYQWHFNSDILTMIAYCSILMKQCI